MDDIPLQHLQAFLIFCDSANTMMAARTLGITQPALSKQLKALEEKLPQAAFSMSGRKKVLTPFGEDLHRQLRSRLQGIQEVVRQTGLTHNDSHRAEVYLAARRGILDRCCNKIKFPGTLEFIEASNEDILQGLLARKIDIGILHSLPNTSELIAKKLFKEEFKIVIPKGLLKEKRHYSRKLLAELTGIPCLAYKRHDEVLTELCLANEISPSALKIKRVTASYTSIAAMVESQLGWAIVPSYLEVSASKTWLMPFPNDIITEREFFLSYRPEFQQTSWFKDLLMELRACF